MAHILRELLKRRPQRTVLIIDEGSYRQYTVEPWHIWFPLIASIVCFGGLLTALVLFTPLRNALLGYDPVILKHESRTHALRVAALEDSLRLQKQYLERLRLLITGQVALVEDENSKSMESLLEGEGGVAIGEALHRASSAVPASPARIVLSTSTVVSTIESSEMVEVLQHGLNFPLLPPVQQGVLTRGFEPVIAHYAIDIAAEEGSPVHAVGEGYVVFADWTQEGGYVIAVQHQGGYLTVYKHNRELLKQIGERVKEGEIIALSGNTGEITTGPHVHFELWRNGQALNPVPYFINLQVKHVR